jgi:hypothetical protein
LAKVLACGDLEAAPMVVVAAAAVVILFSLKKIQKTLTK